MYSDLIGSYIFVNTGINILSILPFVNIGIIIRICPGHVEKAGPEEVKSTTSQHYAFLDLKKGESS